VCSSDLSLVNKGLTRQEAYKMTQKVAMMCYEGGLDFAEEVKKDREIGKYLNEEEIVATMSNEHYFKYVDTIFDRVFEPVDGKG
jgi:adenylosuccinate lyase